MFNRGVIIVSPVKQQRQMHQAGGVLRTWQGIKVNIFSFGVGAQQADVLRKGCACRLR